MLWMMGYDYDRVLHELNDVLHESSDGGAMDNSDTDRDILSGYVSDKTIDMECGDAQVSNL